MANELADFARRVVSITDPASLRRINTKAGMAGKKSALDAAAESLGGDRQFSGMRRKVALSAGFDLNGADSVKVNFRPAGLWRLADQGRRSSGAIRPRKRGGKRALLTPAGPRASSSYGPSRGLNTYTDAVKDARRSVPKAAAAQFRAEVARVVR